MSEELAFTSATELLNRYKTKKLSPVEATKASIAQIERHSEKLNVFTIIATERTWRNSPRKNNNARIWA